MLSSDEEDSPSQPASEASCSSSPCSDLSSTEDPYQLPPQQDVPLRLAATEADLSLRQLQIEHERTLLTLRHKLELREARDAARESRRRERECRSQCDAAAKALEVSHAETHQLREDLEAAQHAVARLTKDIHDLEAQLEESKGHVRRLSTELIDTNTRLRQRDEEVEGLLPALHKLRRAEDALKEANSKLDAERLRAAAAAQWETREQESSKKLQTALQEVRWLNAHHLCCSSKQFA